MVNVRTLTNAKKKRMIAQKMHIAETQEESIFFISPNRQKRPDFKDESWKCKCFSGFRGNGKQCEDFDECQTGYVSSIFLDFMM